MNMKMMNAATVSVYDRNSDRQAKNLNVATLSDAVTPWFEDWSDADVERALALLSVPSQRRAAAEYLGLDLRWVA